MKIGIALIGYSRTGKDTVGEFLQEWGFERVAMGDIIKRDLDPLIKEHFGFSAFTEVDAEKSQIRKLLVEWGYANYDSTAKRFWASLPDQVVNTRVFRIAECREWVARGGAIWEVARPGVGPAEPREEEELATARAEGLIRATIVNDAGLEQLRDEVLKELFCFNT